MADLYRMMEHKQPLLFLSLSPFRVRELRLTGFSSLEGQEYDKLGFVPEGQLDRSEEDRWDESDMGPRISLVAVVFTGGSGTVWRMPAAEKGQMGDLRCRKMH